MSDILSKYWILYRSGGCNIWTRPVICGCISFVILFAAQGCQQLGLRNGDRSLLESSDDGDDWARPTPSPNVAVKDYSRATSGHISSHDEPERVVLTKDRTATSPVRARIGPDHLPAGVVQYGPSENARPGEIASPTGTVQQRESILDTNERDIDVESALASLPEPYRRVLTQQLAAVQNHSSSSIPKSGSEPKSNTSLADNDISKQPAISMRIADGVVEQRTSRENLGQQVMNNPIANPTEALVRTVAHQEVAVAKANDPSVGQQVIATNPVVTASGVEPVIKPAAILPTASLPSTKELVPNASLSWHQSVAQAVECLEKQIHDTPSNDENLRISQEMTLRMLYVTQRRLDDAMRRIELLSVSEHEYFLHQMQALYEASNPDASPVRSRRWSLVMNSQRQATSHLGKVSNLEVRSAAFCTDVQGYGVTTKFAKNHFKPDQDVLLYCEVENVAAEALKNGFETQLQGSYEIIDPQGRRMTDQLLPMEPEICQNHRRDYFIVYRIYMPPQIAPGNYQLRLTIEDMKARKFGQSNLDFQIQK